MQVAGCSRADGGTQAARDMSVGMVLAEQRAVRDSDQQGSKMNRSHLINFEIDARRIAEQQHAPPGAARRWRNCRTDINAAANWRGAAASWAPCPSYQQGQRRQRKRWPTCLLTDGSGLGVHTAAAGACGCGGGLDKQVRCHACQLLGLPPAPAPHCLLLVAKHGLLCTEHSVVIPAHVHQTARRHQRQHEQERVPAPPTTAVEHCGAGQ